MSLTIYQLEYSPFCIPIHSILEGGPKLKYRCHPERSSVVGRGGGRDKRGVGGWASRRDGTQSKDPAATWRYRSKMCGILRLRYARLSTSAPLRMTRLFELDRLRAARLPVLDPDVGHVVRASRGGCERLPGRGPQIKSGIVALGLTGLGLWIGRGGELDPIVLLRLQARG